MTPQQALAAGRLADALALQEEEVAARPDDAAARLFLFELQLLANRFREAWRTVSAIASADPAWPKARRWYRRLVRAAHARTTGRRPSFVADVPAHARRRWKAIRANDPAAALDWIDRADHRTPHVLGHVDGREFDGLRDADDRFASVLEAFVGGGYVWLPFEQLRRVTIPAATGILEGAYRPARVRLCDGEEFNAVLPLVYPGSDSDEAFLLGTDTDHVNPDGGPVRCVGAKLLLIGEEELALGEVRQLDVKAWA
jgi:type VI secretion system protein ImpE